MLRVVCCRGSQPFTQGCWIGLQDPLSTGEFRWISPDALELPSTTATLGAQAVSWYLDWRRLEPNNQSLSEGVPSPARRGGERCAHIVPWQEDPLILEQGSWNDNSCELKKPFVCQIFGDTMRYTLHANTSMMINRGALEGGYLSTGTGVSRIYHLNIARSGSLIVGSDSVDSQIGTVYLDEGSSIVIDATAVQLMSGAYIGELMSIFQRNGRSTVDLISSTYSDDTFAEDAQAESTIDATAFVYDVSSATAQSVAITSKDIITATPLSLQPLIRITSNATLTVSPHCPAEPLVQWPLPIEDDMYSRPPYPMRVYYAGMFQNDTCNAESSLVVLNARIEAAGRFTVANTTQILIPQV